MTHREEAQSLFAGGFNCAQAILAAYGPELGLERDIALRLASAFGAGMGRGEVCGAVSGALMVIGLRFGAANAWNKAQKARLQKRASEFMEKFTALHGSVKCSALIGADLGTHEGRREARRRKVFEGLCTGFVRDALEILDGMI